MPDNTIAFTIHQRPWYFREVLDAWKRVRGVKDWPVRFHIDASPQWEAQVKIAQEFMEWHPDADFCLHQKQMGVTHNPHHAIDSSFIEGAKFVVLAEEDVEPAADVLEYFRWTQQFTDLLASCAWSDGDELQHPYNASRRKWFNPWLWQLSWDQWQESIKTTWDFDYSTGDEHGVGGWDCNLGLRIVHDHGKDVMFPHRSRSRHIGKYVGVHQNPSDFGESEMPAGFVENATGNDWKEVPHVSG